MSDITELVKQAAKGDRAAFDSLYEQTKNGVWFTCISILNNEENAKDIMQDTYLAAFERLRTLSDPAAVQSWLNKIAANKCKNYINAKSNSAVESGEDILDNIPDDGLIPEEYVEDKSKRELIMKIIRDALSEEQYRTIILYYFDEMTAAEIAELMDCHEKTVRYRLKTARVKIKEAIGRYEEENSEKLHAVAPMLPLSRLLRAESENASVPDIAPAAPHSPVNTPNSPSQTAVSAAKTGGKTMLNTLKAKIIAGACAAVVVGGGVTAGGVISNSSKSKTESKPAASAPANVSKPANISASANVNVSNPAESSQSVTSEITNEPTSFPDNPISPEGEVMWELIPTAPAGDFETSPHTPGGVLHEDEIRINRYNGNAEYVKIPEKIDGKTVVLVQGFYSNNDIKGVYFPDGVQFIERLCFSDNQNLKYIRYPETLEKLQEDAIKNCPGLESITLPQSTKILMNGAIKSCENLKSVTVPDSIETMYINPIKNCPDCELHYRGYVFKGDDLDGLELLKGVLTVNGEDIAVGDLGQILGGGASGDSASE